MQLKKGEIFDANHLLGGNMKTLSKIIVASIQKNSNDAHP
jgi:hypothetical protein